jgi:multicomponent Na+:H+ antiporter subunit F
MIDLTPLLENVDSLGTELLQFSIWVAIVLISLALILGAVRLFIGPTLPDRIVALELIASLFVGVVVIASILSGVATYLDVAIALTLVGFLGAIVFARFIERRVGR